MGHDPADGQRLLRLVAERDRLPRPILQPPFFDPHADPAVNYGGIGAVIGHEITHGFDDQGRKTDGDGVLTDWWTPADADKFNTQAMKLGARYEAYDFPHLPGSHINGKTTMGENIADLGGILNAIDAYHLHLHGQPSPVLDGFTGDQRVFLGWAQVWRTLSRDAALKQQLATDPHSPGGDPRFRPAAQRGPVVRSVQHPAGRQTVPRARAARADLVSAFTAAQPGTRCSPLSRPRFVTGWLRADAARGMGGTGLEPVTSGV